MIREEEIKREKLREFYDVKWNEEQLHKLELMEGLDNLVDRIYSKSVYKVMESVNWDRDRMYSELSEIRVQGRHLKEKIEYIEKRIEGNGVVNGLIIFFTSAIIAAAICFMWKFF